MTKKSTKILITGATGFIGKELAQRLLRSSQNKVTVISRNPLRAKNIFGTKVVYFRADITDKKLIRKLPTDFDYIFHAAAAVSYRLPEPSLYYKTNVEGTNNILAVAQLQSHLKKFIYLSSVGVYGPITNPPADESTSHHPETDYERSKDQAEKLVIHQFGRTPTIIIQPTLVYGPSDRNSGMHSFFRAVLSGKYINILGNRTELHPCYMENLIDALLLAQNSSVRSETFIIADPHAFTLSDLVVLIKSIAKKNSLTPAIPLILMRLLGVVGDLVRSFGLPSPISSATVEFMTEHRSYSIAKARKLLNYQPLSTKDGIKKTI